ncbi:synaptotagmin-like protein 2 isoform X5 [Synchiropus splendidus]|uniref:synaptotagmin-like protein 2 isoform X5 n=1 Tax=Synchiropus splendidus TaxID=270530 RepID=UPI00237DE740|nr:synaptotagmin-like protein 2 isoform X5 [Synchiropus splendidus]
MIDLSHLTEEEQGMILTVLRRDAELKKAEEARIRKLEAILERNAQAETKLKYLTGEWFYEAKSRRHRDKIHGSEIILASMKQRKPAGSEGSLKLERFNTPSSHGSDVVVQQRAASTVEAVKAQESNSDAEIQTAVSAVQSPRSLRHNPFNRASLIVVEPVEHADLKLQEHDVYEGESASSLRLLPSDETSQTSSSSLTSRGSSLGLKPVPKKRTFVSRQNSQMDANDLSLDPRTSSAEVVPAPRFSRNQISSGSSNQSYKRGSIETPHKSILSYSSSETYSSLSESTQQVASQHLPNSSLERAASPTASERLTGETSQLNSDAGKVTPRGSATLDYFPAVSAQGSGREVSSSVTSARQDDISLPRSIVGENRDDPLRKALRRAAARPTNMTKSMEDLIASLSPRQKRRHEQAAEKRRTSDAMPLPPIPSPVLSDLKSLKKMSKSVPSCLQKEDDVEESNSACEEEVVSPSMSNITNSAKVTSKPSLSGSVLTMYPGEFGNVEVQGNVQFSINYVQRLNEFHIFVAECRDLAAVDPKRGRSDPYVKTYLHPDRSNLGKRKTSIKKKTLNPTFNEILRYRVHMEYLRTQTLILSVWHHDTFGRNSFLGEVDVDLSKWDFDHTHMNYMALKPRTTPATAPSNGRGEMRLAVRFLPQVVRSEEGPSTGELHIWVKECKNLPLVRAAIDPYVKCFVLPDTSRKSRQKTRVLRRTADPVFNHTMVYDGIREEDLTEACVELTVWDRDRLVNNLLGGLRLGAGTGMSYGAVVDWMDSTQYEVSLWEQMVATPNEWVEDVLPLRMLNTKAAFK